MPHQSSLCILYLPNARTSPRRPPVWWRQQASVCWRQRRGQGERSEDNIMRSWDYIIISSSYLHHIFIPQVRGRTALTTPPPPALTAASRPGVRRGAGQGGDLRPVTRRSWSVALLGKHNVARHTPPVHLQVCCDGSIPDITRRPECPTGQRRPVCPDDLATRCDGWIS